MTDQIAGVLFFGLFVIALACMAIDIATNGGKPRF